MEDENHHRKFPIYDGKDYYEVDGNSFYSYHNITIAWISTVALYQYLETLHSSPFQLEIPPSCLFYYWLFVSVRSNRFLHAHLQRISELQINKPIEVGILSPRLTPLIDPLVVTFRHLFSFITLTCC